MIYEHDCYNIFDNLIEITIKNIPINLYDYMSIF